MFNSLCRGAAGIIGCKKLEKVLARFLRCRILTVAQSLRIHSGENRDFLLEMMQHLCRGCSQTFSDPCIILIYVSLDGYICSLESPLRRISPLPPSIRSLLLVKSGKFLPLDGLFLYGSLRAAARNRLRITMSSLANRVMS